MNATKIKDTQGCFSVLPAATNAVPGPLTTEKPALVQTTPDKRAADTVSFPDPTAGCLIS